MNKIKKSAAITVGIPLAVVINVVEMSGLVAREAYDTVRHGIKYGEWW